MISFRNALRALGSPTTGAQPRAMVLLRRHGLAVLLLLLLVVSSTRLHTTFWDHDTREENDIYYHWVEGGRLLAGENPYARVLDGDMRTNDKYATLFPLFYLLSAATRYGVGVDDYDAWIAFWRAALLVCAWGIGATMLLAFHVRGLTLVGLLAALGVLFNRWVLSATESASIDFIPLLLLLASLVLLQRHLWLSLALLSLSLAVKQIGIVLVPLYLIVVWQQARPDRVRQLLLAAGVIASVPLLLSLPFLAWNAEGFVKSLLFSATRSAYSNNGHYAVDVALGLEGIAARLPMLALMLLGYLLVLRRELGFYSGALWTMAIVILFNSVLFNHYLNWFVPLIFLALLDRFARREHTPSAA